MKSPHSRVIFFSKHTITFCTLLSLEIQQKVDFPAKCPIESGQFIEIIEIFKTMKQESGANIKGNAKYLKSQNTK